MRHISIAIAVLALATAGCASSGACCPEEETSYSFRPAETRPQVEVASSQIVSEPAPTPARTTRTDLPAAKPAPRPAPAAASGPWLRLRGSDEIHVSTCEKVRRAASDGVVSARRGDGPPCFFCMKEEALAWGR